MGMRFEQLYQYVEVVIDSKIDEFRYYGYKAITKEQLWNYCLDKKWRKKDVGQLHLYEIVATIYEVSPSNIMNYEQVSTFSYTQDVSLSKEELDLLLYAPLQDKYKDII